MVDAPDPFAKKKLVRRFKLGLLAIVCGGAVALLAYGAVALTSSSSPSSSRPISAEQ
ncbi:MAG: hypothetical protein ABJE47_06465 [bacterium]